MSVSDVFFFLSCEEIEGIVVLEVLVSYQYVVLRDIFVYYGWVIEDSVELVIDVDGFVEKLDKVLFGKSDKIKEGYYVVES